MSLGALKMFHDQCQGLCGGTLKNATRMLSVRLCPAEGCQTDGGVPPPFLSVFLLLLAPFLDHTFNGLKVPVLLQEVRQLIS